jgi:hypothetical protein
VAGVSRRQASREPLALGARSSTGPQGSAALSQTPELARGALTSTEAEPWPAQGTSTRQLLLRDWQLGALSHESDEDGLAWAAEAESAQMHEFDYEHRGPRNR